MTYPDTQLLINGKWQSAASGRTIPVINPATGNEIGLVAHAELSDIEKAVEASLSGFKAWKSKTPAERSNIMRNAAALLRERAPAIAKVMTQEQGKPVGEALGEIIDAADTIEWFADEGLRIYGRVVPHRRDPAIRQMVVKDPVGPVAAFSPWNYPINQLVLKLSAALAAGCSVIAKAAEETPASPAALIASFVDAGIPAGTLGLLYGDPAEISTHLIAHPAIRKITFTGSTPVGKHLASLAGRYMKRSTMELGGHAPVIVCEDADIDLAVKATGFFKFRNAGQVCIAPTQFLVHSSVAESFVEGITKVAREVKVGNGLDEGVEMGPLANPRRLEAMAELVEDAVSRGAKVLTGGSRIEGRGFFWAPTVLINVPLEAKIFNEEPFGPLVPIHTFKSLDEAIEEANRLPYGLAGYAYSRSPSTIERLSREIVVGMLWSNMTASTSPELPFGGLKDSGYGTEGGPEALEAYLNTRIVVTRQPY